MNYLAHAFLSFEDPEILAGNMISDFVKGRKQYNYPLLIRQGIGLHRAIDAFTDRHPATHTANKLLQSGAGRYASVFTDVAYDHFLAKDNLVFPGNSLAEFAQRTYQQLSAMQDFFPEKFAAIFPYMRSQNWLVHYKTLDGIEKSFGGVVRRARYLTDAAPAFQCFLKNYPQLESAYTTFFPELRNFAQEQFDGMVRV